MSDRIKIHRPKQLNNSYSYPQLATDSSSVKMDATYGSANHDISRISLRPQAQLNESYRIASDITGVFEGGKPSSLQTKDAGIISYGKHQATLASGSLYSVLKVYTDLSKGNTVTKIANYLPQVQKKDAQLRKDAEFL